MPVRKLKITYQDENREPEVVKILPRALVMSEEHLKGFKTENAYAMTFHLGWAASNVLRKTDLDYETWLNTIEDVEDVTWLDEVEDAANEPDPTQPDPSGDTSSD